MDGKVISGIVLLSVILNHLIVREMDEHKVCFNCDVIHTYYWRYYLFGYMATMTIQEATYQWSYYLNVAYFAHASSGYTIDDLTYQWLIKSLIIIYVWKQLATFAYLCLITIHISFVDLSFYLYASICLSRMWHYPHKVYRAYNLLVPPGTPPAGSLAHHLLAHHLLAHHLLAHNLHIYAVLYPYPPRGHWQFEEVGEEAEEPEGEEEPAEEDEPEEEEDHQDCSSDTDSVYSAINIIHCWKQSISLILVSHVFRIL